MKTTVKHLSDTKVQLTISIGTDELAAAEQVALKKLSATVKVPGFRKGKVPISVAEKHIEPQALQEQLLDDAISKAVAEAFVSEQIQALDRPMVDVKKYVPGDMLEFTAEVEALPKITLGDYKKLTKKQKAVKVEASDVEDILERMRQGFAEKTEVERAAKEGDEAVIDFVGKKGGVAFDGGTGTDYTLKLGSGQFIPGFEEGVEGHKAGEEFDLELEFPKDYHAKDLAGQKVVFTVTLKKVIESTLPELTDELAKKAGPFETVKELKADIEREIRVQKEKEAAENHKDELLTELIEKSNVKAPELLVTDQMRSIEQDFAQNLMYRGLDLQTYLQANGFADEADWREKEVKPAAEKRVKASLVLNELSKAENITATEAEIDEHVELHKRQYANNPEVLKQFETKEVRRDIANHYVTEKTIDRLIEINGGTATPHA